MNYLHKHKSECIMDENGKDTAKTYIIKGILKAKSGFTLSQKLEIPTLLS